MVKRPGKEFEAEIGKSLKHAGVLYYNSNDPKPRCDHEVIKDGAALLLEEKEVRSVDVSFRCLTDAERRHLEAYSQAGCEGWVLIKLVRPSKPRAFACEWSDWVEMEQYFGFDVDAKRNKPGTASFVLEPDHLRPSCFVELTRIERPNGLGKCWDLAPVLGRSVCTT